MRHLRYLPLAYIVGMSGFVYFLPYLFLCITLYLLKQGKLARAN